MLESGKHKKETIPSFPSQTEERELEIDCAEKWVVIFNNLN